MKFESANILDDRCLFVRKSGIIIIKSMRFTIKVALLNKLYI